MRGTPIAKGVTLAGRGGKGYSVCLGCGDETPNTQTYCDSCSQAVKA